MTGPRQRLARWVAFCASAEFLGLAVAALIFGTIQTHLGDGTTLLGKIVRWVLSTSSGAPEGFILGAIQAIGITRIFGLPLDIRTFAIRTIIVALLGWGVGTAIPIFIPTDASTTIDAERALITILAYACLFGAVAGAVFGLLQRVAFAGRRLQRDWLTANVLGWAIALPIIFLFAQTAGDFDGRIIKVTLWTIGGLLGGIAIGLTTGWALQRAHGRAVTETIPLV